MGNPAGRLITASHARTIAPGDFPRKASGRRLARNHLVELADGSLDPVVHQLIGAQPANAALADASKREDILAERFLRLVEVSRPDHVAAPNVHQVQNKRHGSWTLGAPVEADDDGQNGAKAGETANVKYEMGLQT